jgi:FlaA1/EpsC-like NDP-sugar epimerase
MPDHFATSVVGFMDAGFVRLVRGSGPFDVVLNFAALKHVRTERDAFGLMRMIETNALALERAYALLGGRPGVRLFSVSSDKAVAPTSLMGATKRWMERVLANHPDGVIATSARFANVAFSNGSLLQSFLYRLSRRQPLAAPNDVRRYFISHVEAAQLCLMAGLLGGTREIFVPRLDPGRHAIRMDEAAERVLEFHGMKAEPCASEEMAKNHPLLSQSAPKTWPCWFAPSDTSGEKGCEEFLYADERLDESRFTSITVALQQPPDGDALERAREQISAVKERADWSKEALMQAIAIAVPELAHIERTRSLDEKL